VKRHAQRNSAPRNSAMKEQLNQVSGSLTLRRNGSSRLTTRSPNQWEADGVDHVNIHYSGSTQLGSLLNFTNTSLRFTHSVFGTFRSTEGFWNYLRFEERDDRFRDLIGRYAREIYPELTPSRVTNLSAMVMQAAWERVCQHPKLKKMLFESSGEFDMYSVLPSGVCQRPPMRTWVCEGYEEIRAAIQQGRDPDFTFMMDRVTDDLFEEVRPKNVPMTKPPYQVRSHHFDQPKKKKEKPKAEETSSQKTNQKQKSKDQSAKPAEKPIVRQYTSLTGTVRAIPIISDSMNADTIGKCFYPLDPKYPKRRISGTDYSSGPVTAEEWVDLIEISQTPELIESGYVSPDDRLVTATNGNVHPDKQNFFQIRDLAVFTDSNSLTPTYIPVNLCFPMEMKVSEPPVWMKEDLYDEPVLEIAAVKDRTSPCYGLTTAIDDQNLHIGSCAHIVTVDMKDIRVGEGAVFDWFDALLPKYPIDATIRALFFIDMVVSREKLDVGYGSRVRVVGTIAPVGISIGAVCYFTNECAQLTGISGYVPDMRRTSVPYRKLNGAPELIPVVGDAQESGEVTEAVVD